METTSKRLREQMASDEEVRDSCAGSSSDAGVSGQFMEGLPDHLAMECLARVPLSSMRGVSKMWQSVIYDPHFQSLREAVGSAPLDWVYTLVQTRDNTFKWRALNPFALQWHDLPPPPHPMEFQLSNPDCIGVSYSVQCASTRTQLVMVSALKARKDSHGPRMTMEPALDRPYIFDTRTCAWKQGAPFRVPRKWCVCGVADQSLYVASGSGKHWDRELSKSVEIYHLGDDKWHQRRSLSSSKFSGEAMNAVTNDEKLYFVSGRGVFSKDGVVHDVATDSWSEMAPGLKKGWTGPCVAVNGKFYVLETPAGKLKVYVPEDDAWNTIMVDVRLQNLEVFVGTRGKIVAIEAPLKDPADPASSGGRLLRVIDLASDVPHIFDIPVEEGQVVSVQVLAMMHNRPKQ
jgi:hypothetical protein